MFTNTQNTRKTISAVAAVAIVSFSGLVMDQAHLASAPAGTVEVGELTPVSDTGMTVAALPEVIVVAKRVTTFSCVEYVPRNRRLRVGFHTSSSS